MLGVYILPTKVYGNIVFTSFDVKAFYNRDGSIDMNQVNKNRLTSFDHVDDAMEIAACYIQDMQEETGLQIRGPQVLKGN